MSVNKKCRDFDTVLDWHERNLVEEPKMRAIKKPDDVVPLPLPALLMELIADDDATKAMETGKEAEKAT